MTPKKIIAILFTEYPANIIRCTGLETATDMVANVTNIFSLVTKNSGLVAKVATRFLYDLDLNLKKSKVKTDIPPYLALLFFIKMC